MGEDVVAVLVEQPMGDVHASCAAEDMGFGFVEGFDPLGDMARCLQGVERALDEGVGVWCEAGVWWLVAESPEGGFPDERPGYEESVLF
jgi:hypothetical protein